MSRQEMVEVIGLLGSPALVKEVDGRLVVSDVDVEQTQYRYASYRAYCPGRRRRIELMEEGELW
jgi:hypothetical protein